MGTETQTINQINACIDYNVAHTTQNALPCTAFIADFFCGILTAPKQGNICTTVSCLTVNMSTVIFPLLHFIFRFCMHYYFRNGHTLAHIACTTQMTSIPTVTTG